MTTCTSAKEGSPRTAQRSITLLASWFGATRFCAAFIIVLLPVLAGCTAFDSSSGNAEIAKDDVVAQIVPGKTTKAEVRELLGQPADVQFYEGGETWQYRFFASKVKGSTFIPLAGAFAGGNTTEEHTLTLRFGEDGVVKNVGRGSSSGKTGS